MYLKSLWPNLWLDFCFPNDSQAAEDKQVYMLKSAKRPSTPTIHHVLMPGRRGCQPARGGQPARGISQPGGWGPPRQRCRHDSIRPIRLTVALGLKMNVLGSYLNFRFVIGLFLSDGHRSWTTLRPFILFNSHFPQLHSSILHKLNPKSFFQRQVLGAFLNVVLVSDSFPSNTAPSERFLLVSSSMTSTLTAYLTRTQP